MLRSTSLAGLVALTIGLLTACDSGSSDGKTDSETESDVETGTCNLSVDPTEYDFGTVELNSLTPTTLELTNSGDGDCEITTVAVDDPFSLSAEAPITVSAGSSSQLSVYFLPDDYGDFQSFVTLSTADTDLEVLVLGSVSADADGDGYDTTEAGGNDCDDSDADINPAAEEQYYDDVDQNCDGENDFDQDGDGFEACSDDNDDTETCDCVDVDADIYPGAPDEWYDGVNSDCGDESDFDQDGDGWTSEAYGGSDCDDENPDISVEGVEVFNGADDDCNGVVDDDAPADDAWASIWGSTSTDAAGRAVAVGDFDGSGENDLVIGVPSYNYSSTLALYGDAPGALAVFYDGDWDSVDDIDSGTIMEGAEADDELGYAVVNVGDWDGTGGDDIAASSWAYDSRAGKVYVISGDDLSGGDIGDALLSLEGEDDYRIGIGLGGMHDVNGDGTNDLAVYGTHSGMAYNLFALQYGGSTGELTWTEVDSTWRYKCGKLSTGSNSYCGSSTTGNESGGTETWHLNAHAGADFNGDGYGDIVLGDQYYDNDDYNNTGKVWILWGQSTEYSRTNSGFDATATTIYEGTGGKNFIGGTVGALPDVDGDGDNELVFSDEDAGVLYYYPGSEDLEAGNVDLEDADAVMDYGDTTTALVNIGDWSGDDIEDFAIARGDDGFVMFFYSQEWSGTYDLEDEMDGSLENGDDNEYFGYAIAQSPADMDGDGDMDLVAGDYGAGFTADTADTGGTDIDAGTGAVYLYENLLINEEPDTGDTGDTGI